VPTRHPHTPRAGRVVKAKQPSLKDQLAQAQKELEKLRRKAPQFTDEEVLEEIERKAVRARNGETVSQAGRLGA
jgi:hypothetical protein